MWRAAATTAKSIVTFKNKYADWQPLFYGLLPASTNKSPKIFNDGWRARPLTTAGPFKLGSIDQTAKTVTLVRNEKWWGKPAKLDTIVFRAIDADAQIDALANGEIDLMDIGPDVNKYSRAKGIAGTEIRVAGGPNFRHVTINGTGEILKDVKVRQALAMAIDRAAIARAMLGPLGIDPTTLGNHIFMRNQTGYQDNSGDVGKYNPDTCGAAAGRGGVEARRQGAQERRSHAGDQLRDSVGGRHVAAGIGADSEHARSDRREVGDQHGAVAGLLREIHQARAVRLHGLLVDGHAISDQLVAVALCEADHGTRRRARHPAELRACRIGRHRQAVRPGDAGARP